MTREAGTRSTVQWQMLFFRLRSYLGVEELNMSTRILILSIVSFGTFLSIHVIGQSQPQYRAIAGGVGQSVLVAVRTAGMEMDAG